MISLPDPLPIASCGPVNAVIRVPGSKSITNRALAIAALANGRSILRGALFSDDTRRMVECLGKLGIDIHADEENRCLSVEGLGGVLPAHQADLFCGNSGTTLRTLTAVCALGQGTYRLDGVPRMRERPIGDLLKALQSLGVDAQSEVGNGCPPVNIRGNGVSGGVTRVRGDISSQYLTALLLVGPYANGAMHIEVEGDLASKPYVDITLRMMEEFGVRVERDAYRSFVIQAGQVYQPKEYVIEPDASSASYFFAAAALLGGRVTVPGLAVNALQGDVRFVQVLEQMGSQVYDTPNSLEVRGGELHGVEVDMNAISDTVMTLAAIAPFASSPTHIHNVANIRHKETDRLKALATELTRLGVQVDERPDGLSIFPCREMKPAIIQTYDDHRMAMSFSIAGLRFGGISITDPTCVNKTYPGFWDDLDRLRQSAK